MASAQNVPGMGAPISGSDGFVTSAWRNFFVSLWNRTGGGTDTVSSASVIGEIKAYGGSLPPTSWLICNGSQLSRVAYSDLFGVIGTLYGAGDGSSTFSLPDFRGRSLMGAGSAPSLTTRSIGEIGGVESVTLTTTQMPSHTHTITDTGHAHAVTDPGHHHSSLVTGTNAATGTASGSTSGVTGNSTTGVTINSATTGITVNSTGGADVVPILQPFGVVNYIIRAQ